jgi:hypothetical protein
MNEVNAYQLALARCEQEIAVIEAQVAKLSADKDKLQYTRAALSKQLGLPVPAGSSSFGHDMPDEDESVAHISRNSFRNMRSTEAARKYLLMMGHPQTHEKLVKALLKGGVLCGSSSPKDSIRTSLRRREDWFVWKPDGKRGMWQLREWQLSGEITGTVAPIRRSTPTPLSVIASSDPLDQ